MTAHQHHAEPAAAPGSTVRDPVCGMTVDPHAGKPSQVHDGRTFHFCGRRCRDRFAVEPQAYQSTLI